MPLINLFSDQKWGVTQHFLLSTGKECYFIEAVWHWCTACHLCYWCYHVLTFRPSRRHCRSSKSVLQDFQSYTLWSIKLLCYCGNAISCLGVLKHMETWSVLDAPFDRCILVKHKNLELRPSFSWESFIFFYSDSALDVLQLCFGPVLPLLSSK